MQAAITDSIERPRTKPLCRTKLYTLEASSFTTDGRSRKLAIKITPSSPQDYISRFSSILHLSPKSQNDALRILKKADISELTSGRGPAGIAAAALYVAALINDEKKTQREVADVAGITEVTIRNRYKELIDRLGLEDKLKIKEAEQKIKK